MKFHSHSIKINVSFYVTVNWIAYNAYAWQPDNKIFFLIKQPVAYLHRSLINDERGGESFQTFND